MTEFQNRSFSVYPGKDGGEKYRDAWDAIFAKCPKCEKAGCGWYSESGQCGEKQRITEAMGGAGAAKSDP